MPNIDNEKRNALQSLEINFKAAGWFGHDLNRFEGFILGSDKQKLRFLYGKWNDYLKSAPIDEYETFQKNNKQKFRAPDNSGGNHQVLNEDSRGSRNANNNGDADSADPNSEAPSENSSNIPKSDSAHSLHIPCSRILWQAAPRPNHSDAYYNFNAFTFRLNDPGAIDDHFRGQLPPTDSRFRPDVRKLEEGDLGKFLFFMIKRKNSS